LVPGNQRIKPVSATDEHLKTPRIIMAPKPKSRAIYTEMSNQPTTSVL